MYYVQGARHTTRNKKEGHIPVLAGFTCWIPGDKVKHKEAQLFQRVPHVMMTIKQGGDSTEHTTAGGSH